jgi:hypothetical protein
MAPKTDSRAAPLTAYVERLRRQPKGSDTELSMCTAGTPLDATRGGADRP